MLLHLKCRNPMALLMEAMLKSRNATGNMQRKACSECGRIALRCEIEMAPIFGIHALTAESRTALKIGTDDDLNGGRKQCADRRNRCSRM